MYKKVQRAQTTNHANYTETLSVAVMTVKRKENQDGYLYVSISKSLTINTYMYKVLKNI